MRRIRKRNVFAVGVVAAIATAFAVTAATVQAGSGVPNSIGKGEGWLNVIEWAHSGNTEPSNMDLRVFVLPRNDEHSLVQLERVSWLATLAGVT